MTEPVSPMLSLRPATEADVPYLFDLRVRTMGEHLDRAGLCVSAEEHEARVRIHFESCLIVMSDQTVAGMLKLHREPESWKLVQIQVEPKLQGQGLGEELLRRVVSEANAARVSVRLNVLKANPAKRLYERLGFKLVAEGDLEYEMQTEVQL